MKRERKCLRLFNSAVVFVLVLGLGMLNIHVPSASAVEKIAADKVETTGDEAAAETEASKVTAATEGDKSAQDAAKKYQKASIKHDKAAAPETKKTNSGGHTLLYAGVGIAAIAAGVAIAAGGSGGSSSSETTTEAEKPKVEPVGADIGGDNWHGRLVLKDSGYKEDVTATVVQTGSRLVITTSSVQKYGKSFSGSINRSANITVRDQNTGQDWTTHYTKARWNMIDLYDYVHNFHDLDRLYLEREAKQ